MDKLSEEDSENYNFQEEGRLLHCIFKVRQYLNTTLPDRWIEQSKQNNCILILWSPISPDLRPCNFFVQVCERISFCFFHF